MAQPYLTAASQGWTPVTGEQAHQSHFEEEPPTEPSPLCAPAPAPRTINPRCGLARQPRRSCPALSASMRILGLLAALLVLALPGQAEPLGGTTEQVPGLLGTASMIVEQVIEERYLEPWEDQQDQPKDKDQDTAMSDGNKRFSRALTGQQKNTVCTCRSKACVEQENALGKCPTNDSMTLLLCCM